MGTILNRALPSINGVSLEITLTVPLMRPCKGYASGNFENKNNIISG